MNRLKMWRLERGLSQQELMSVSGVPRHVIQLVEAGIGEPTREQRVALAKAVGTPVDKVFEFQHAKKSRKGVRHE